MSLAETHREINSGRSLDYLPWSLTWTLSPSVTGRMRNSLSADKAACVLMRVILDVFNKPRFCSLCFETAAEGTFYPVISTDNYQRPPVYVQWMY